MTKEQVEARVKELNWVLYSAHMAERILPAEKERVRKAYTELQILDIEYPELDISYYSLPALCR